MIDWQPPRGTPPRPSAVMAGLAVILICWAGVIGVVGLLT